MMPSSTSLSRSARSCALRLPARRARTQLAIAASGGGIARQLARHAIAQAFEHHGAPLALERFGLPLDRAAPPVEHRFAGGRALRQRRLEAAFEHRRGGAEVVFEEQRLTERHHEIDVIAGVEIDHAHGAELGASRGEIGGIGALAIALEVRPRQDDGGGVGGGADLLRVQRRQDRLVELLLVIGGAGAGQLGALCQRRAGTQK
jgi:hypothetical protein